MLDSIFVWIGAGVYLVTFSGVGFRAGVYNFQTPGIVVEVYSMLATPVPCTKHTKPCIPERPVVCSLRHHRWENFSEQTYSCTRDWRVSASWMTKYGPPWNPLNIPALCYWEVDRGLSNRCPWCREAPVLRKAGVIFPSIVRHWLIILCAYIIYMYMLYI